ncbi:hypothetical protein [Alterisphingorhabdus coralli]|uniref:Uncharacterized protein n=1 Tax=Alterisphingorhabdus coralli TaxID=3071408 RepID=A0AA97F806_9SPHN|nr:hypothetical protein [Parasphingorhabdus sp. SCSIO 66989]WOE75673.1 hypothetical protein RB602_02860 [Parasphingorhabdus sp. SCSIO 66989]
MRYAMPTEQSGTGGKELKVSDNNTPVSPKRSIASLSLTLRTEGNKHRFLRRLRGFGRLGETALACGVSNGTHGDWRRQDPDFAEACRVQISRYRRNDRPKGRVEEDSKSDFIAYVAHFHKVPLALRFVGWDMLHLHRLLRDDPDFVAEWHVALGSICTEIELILLHIARFGIPPETVGEPSDERQFDVTQMLKTLHYWQSKQAASDVGAVGESDALMKLRQKLESIRDRSVFLPSSSEEGQ